MPYENGILRSVSMSDVSNHASRGKFEKYNQARTFRGQYVACAAKQLEDTIDCAEETRRIVKSFFSKINTREWALVGTIPQERQVKISNATTQHYSDIGTKKGKTRDSVYVRGLVNIYKPNTQTIICNSGWTTDNCENFPQNFPLALPCYSFKWSEGRYMIGSMRASVDYRCKVVAILQSTIMPMEGSRFGFENIGIKGIYNFFWNPLSKFVPNFKVPEKSKVLLSTQTRKFSKKPPSRLCTVEKFISTLTATHTPENIEPSYG